MNKFVAFAISGSLLVAGCAPVQYTKADLDGLVVCNVDAMDAVERAAKRNFTQIVWVNCPRAVIRVVEPA
ncbi:MAG TPA: hypothetical protein VNE58_15770 [Casimicrobiaceae bacterium]|nr:hypothetical protein [Casimicrobiaceae bacterium]